MVQPVDEPIDAYVIYQRGAPHPLLRAFRWRNRRFEVTATNLVYPERDGETRFLCYAVSSGANQFRIRLNTNRCQWTLDAIELES